MIQKWLYPFMMNHFLVFFITAISGTIMSMSANSWWVGWLGMEINLLGFIMLLMNNNSNEKSLKYFVIQSLGSVILISSALLSENFNMNYLNLLLNISLFLKLGAAPLHYWLPVIVEDLSKFQLTFLLTWQKIAPLYLLFSLPLHISTYIFMVSSLVMGAMSSLNELRFFTLITYSSISHTGWMLLSMLTNEIVSILYIMVYTLLISSMLIALSNKNNQTIWFLKNPNSFIMLLNLLSLGGLPPFTGFIMKWILVTEIYFLTNILINMLLMTTSIMLIYFYLRMTMNSFLKNSLILKFTKLTKINNLTSFSLMNLTGIYLLFVYIISMKCTSSF